MRGEKVEAGGELAVSRIEEHDVFEALVGRVAVSLVAEFAVRVEHAPTLARRFKPSQARAGTEAAG